MARSIDSNMAKRGLRGFDGVAGVIGGWERPRTISDQIMSDFMAMAESGVFDWDAPGPVFRAGCKVVVTAGPFAGLLGKVLGFGKKGKGDPIVEIDILGRPTPSMIPLALLQKV